MFTISIFFFVVAPIASFQHPVAIHHLPYGAANIHCTARLKHNRFPSTALHLSPSLCDSAMALSAVTLSSSIGFVSDKMNLFGGSAGIIVTLLSAGMLSNIDIFGLSIPSEHKIYDLCWTKFLPASLALVLLASSKDNSKESKSLHTGMAEQEPNINKEIVLACSVPFTMGSIGSILGCIFSAILLSFCGNRGSPMIGMEPIEAAIAAGCICATYIGGSVNFFATAKILSSQYKSKFPVAKMSNLLSALAAADLLAMAIYFGALSSLVSNKRLQSLFPGRRTDDGNLIPTTHRGLYDDIAKTSVPSGFKRLCMSGIAASFLALLIIEISTRFETAVSRFVPGMACAAVAAMATSASKLLGEADKLERSKDTRFMHLLSKFQTDLRIVGPPMSEFCFLLMFGAIGVSANLNKVFSQGLSTVTSAILAILIHFITLGIGSLLLTNLVPINKFTKKIFPLALEEMLVSSNAAIGGAISASAFAANLRVERFKGNAKRALIYAGTFWGVIGYAGGTTVGIFLTKALASWLLI